MNTKEVGQKKQTKLQLGNYNILFFSLHFYGKHVGVFIIKMLI
jgi:hypothetical protein